MITRSLLFTLLFTFSLNAKAAVDNDIDSFLNDVGLSSNTTAPAHWSGKDAEYYSAGSLYVRSKVKNVNPVNVRLPELRAGCGGIDFYAGGFSFINEDQFEALGNAILSNAGGFVFKAALGLVSPAFEGWVDDLQKIIQKANNFNLNSCAMAEAAVGTLASLNTKTARAYCKTKGNHSGLFNDFAEAQAKCDNENAATNENSSKEDQNAGAPPRNLVWNILTKNEGGSLAASDQEYYELLMTLTGTFILRADPNLSMPIGGVGADKDTIDKFLNGGDLYVLKCDDYNLCLNPSHQSFKITESQSFKGRVKEMISSIREKVKDEQSGDVQQFTAKEQYFLNNVPYGIPLLKIIETQQAYKKFDSVFSLDGLEEWMALGLLYNFLGETISKVESDTYFNMAANELERTTFLKLISSLKSSITSKSADLNDKLDVVNRQIKSVKAIEDYMNSKNILTNFTN